MNQLILNGKELRESLNISTTTFYKFKKAGMPYHQFPASRAYYVLDEVKTWLSKSGYHHETTWTK
mgnify:FL=1